MSSTRIRPARTTAELHAVCDVATAAFAPRDARWIQRAIRLACPRRARAQAWLLEEEGQVVCSLLAYPLEFVTPDDEVAQGFGFGAVATLPEARRRGHANALCEHVAAHEAEEGRGVGLLFSGIPTAYYERLGWRSVPAWKHETTRLTELADGPRVEWNAIDPRREREGLSRLYRDAHRGSLHLHRDETGWRQTLVNVPDDMWLGLGPVDGELRGYARVGRGKTTLEVVELVLARRSDEEPALRGLAALALETERERLAGWLPPSPPVETWFERGDRSTTQPMILGTTAERAAFGSSDYF